ncbi:G3BP2 [Cordylochernes scorpioides]|uniref:G3BP2 n=1 Tax=Cordylochernes scorpioides TaxID=51811 RepID=A0ABY6KHK2_9ARAC|nr:G3BP2 [Cordylochernes scorpioides]
MPGYILGKFYNDNSTFTHGGFDQSGQETKPVVGQQEIHNKIMELRFRDCHAKIQQVDSHQTLENAVVVQVTGELSNNGKPMRRFVQTFVLVPQSPKKFYVRNDIFRYQDDGYNDEDTPESQSNDEPPSEEAPPTPVVENIQEQAIPYYHPQEEQPEVRTNGGTNHVEPPAAPTPPESHAAPEWEDAAPPAPVTPVPLVEPPQPVCPEPKTYANMVSKSTGTLPPAPMAPQPVITNNVPAVTTPASPPVVPPSKPPAEKSSPPAQEEDGFERRKYGNSNSGPLQYPDNQQLFVGNLIHSITEEDLREHFSKYGNVLEMRINKQNPQKMGNKVPNFGFVVFEDPECVMKVLKEKPIFFKNHRLNVEEKKVKLRSSISEAGRGGRGGGGGGGGGVPVNSRGGMTGGNRGGGSGGGNRGARSYIQRR